MTGSTQSPPVSWFAVWKHPFLSNRPTRISLLVAVCLLSAFIAYFSTYLAIVDEGGLVATVESEAFIIGPSPDYSCGNTLTPRWSSNLEKFFRPAHRMDKLLRRAKWDPLTHEITPEDRKIGEFQIRLKPEWKKNLPPNQESLFITVPLPDRPSNAIAL